jgi:hypothetical protein
MKDLFKYYMISGMGVVTHTKYGLKEDGIAYFGRNQSRINWGFYSNEKYTIGLVEYNSLRTEKSDFSIRRREHAQLMLILEDLLGSLNCNNVEGENYKLN